MARRLAVLLLALPAAVSAQVHDAATILRPADRAVLGETAAYTLRMTVVRPGKPERVVEMKRWNEGDEQGLARYTAPAKERGTAYLRSGESTWLFPPQAEKVVRVEAALLIHTSLRNGDNDHAGQRRATTIVSNVNTQDAHCDQRALHLELCQSTPSQAVPISAVSSRP